MDSPVRKMQKRNDYNRHKLLRKIKKQREAEKEQQAHVAEKELKRKLRKPKYDGGKDPYKYNFDSSAFDENGNLKPELEVTTPDVVVTGDAWRRQDAMDRRERVYQRMIQHSEIGPDGRWYPGHGALQQVSPEFDMLTLSPVFKSIGNYVGQSAMHKMKNPIMAAVMNRNISKGVKQLSPTEKIFQILGKSIPETPVARNRASERLFKQSPLAQRLEKDGVNLDLLTSSDLRKISKAYEDAFSTYAHFPDRRGLVDKAYNVNLYNKKGFRVGNITTEGHPIAEQNRQVSYVTGGDRIPMVYDDTVKGVHMINNDSYHLRNIPQKEFLEMFPYGQESGVSEDLYNIIIDQMNKTGEYDGLYTGRWLLQPEKTLKVTSKYNSRMDFPNTGYHSVDGKYKLGASSILMKPSKVPPLYRNYTFGIDELDNFGNFTFDR